MKAVKVNYEEKVQEYEDLLDEPHSKKQKEDIGSSTFFTSPGFIHISDVDPEGKYVQIKNMSDKVSE